MSLERAPTLDPSRWRNVDRILAVVACADVLADAVERLRADCPVQACAGDWAPVEAALARYREARP